LKDELVYRAQKDEAFRQELIANPVTVLKREYPEVFLDGTLLSDINIQVMAEDANTLCIVLPIKSDVLTRSELLTKKPVPNAYIYTQ
jgi:hypothetical protein